jgi:hypothetical protein
MLHPNQVAIDHIWGRFMEVYFDNETKEFIQKWEKIVKPCLINPLTPKAKNIKSSIKKTIDQLNEFSDRINIQKN